MNLTPRRLRRDFNPFLARSILCEGFFLTMKVLWSRPIFCWKYWSRGLNGLHILKNISTISKEKSPQLCSSLVYIFKGISSSIRSLQKQLLHLFLLRRIPKVKNSPSFSWEKPYMTINWGIQNWKSNPWPLWKWRHTFKHTY